MVLSIIERLPFVIQGFFLYFLLCSVLICIGLSIINIFRLSLSGFSRLFLAPVLGFVFLSLLLGIVGGLKVTIKDAAPWLWLIIILFTLFGLKVIADSFLRKKTTLKEAASQSPVTRDETLLDGEKGLIVDSSEHQNDLERAKTYGSSRPKLQIIGDSIKNSPRTKPLLILFLVSLFPVITMVRYFLNGLTVYLGSLAPDGWSYISIAQYMWEYPRGIEVRLAPLYQYGVSISNSRYIGFTMLGLFSPLVKAGDTLSVSGLLQALALFVFACSVAFYWITSGKSYWVVVIGTFLSVVCGWVADLLWVNNYDNGLALVYFPAIAGLGNFIDVRNWKWWAILGGLFAGTLYTYPELALVIIGAGIFAILPGVWSQRLYLKAILKGFLISIIVGLVLLLPYLPGIVPYFQTQLAAASASGARAGDGIFAGLTMPGYQLSAFWGLGGEFPLTSNLVTNNFFGIILSLLAITGCFMLFRNKSWGLSGSIILVTAGALFYIILKNYSYGAYKFIIIEWWALIFVIITALEWLFRRLPKRLFRLSFSGSLFILILIVSPQTLNILLPNNPWNWVVGYTDNSMNVANYSQVLNIKEITKNDPVLLMVDNFTDNEWAVYFLRDIHIRIGAYREYMANGIQIMERAEVIQPSQLKYVLTDQYFDGKTTNWQLLWSGGEYKLWKPTKPDWIFIASLAGIQNGDQQQPISLNNNPTTLPVWSSRDGEALLSGNFADSSSNPSSSTYKLEITTGNGPSQIISVQPGENQIRISVKTGETLLSLKMVSDSTGNNPSNSGKLNVTNLKIAYIDS